MSLFVQLRLYHTTPSHVLNRLTIKRYRIIMNDIFAAKNSGFAAVFKKVSLIFSLVTFN
jgi:hypothetical protein